MHLPEAKFDLSRATVDSRYNEVQGKSKNILNIQTIHYNRRKNGKNRC